MYEPSLIWWCFDFTLDSTDVPARRVLVVEVALLGKFYKAVMAKSPDFVSPTIALLTMSENGKFILATKSYYRSDKASGYR